MFFQFIFWSDHPIDGSTSTTSLYFQSKFYSPTICQPVEQENVKIPVSDFFQHALQDRE